MSNMLEMIEAPSVILDWQQAFIDSMKSRAEYKRRLWFNISNHAMMADRLNAIAWIRTLDDVPYVGPAVFVEDYLDAYTPHPHGYGHCLPPDFMIIHKKNGCGYVVYPGGKCTTIEEDPIVDTYDEFMTVSEDEACEYDSMSTDSSDE